MPVNVISEGQQPNAAGDFIDVYQISYTAPPNPAPLTVNIPKSAGQQALQDAVDKINELTAFVQGLYALP
jgi:hypothetical protein